MDDQLVGLITRSDLVRSWPELLQDEQKSTQIEMWEDDVDIDTSLSSAM